MSNDTDPALSASVACEVCGRDVDACICPTCAVCGAAGRIECYAVVKSEDKADHHGLLMSRSQVVSRVQRRISILQAQIVDESEAVEWLKDLPAYQLVPVAGAEVLRMRREKKK